MAIRFITNYPLIAQNTTGTSVVASGAINQSGMIYSVIVPSASGVPSAQQIYDGQNSASGNLASNLICSGEASASGVEVALSGYSLTSETDYIMYVTASGYDDGLYASGEPLSFTTPDITAPSWSGSYPSLVTAYGTSGVFALAVDESDCSGFAYILASGESEPSAGDIVASGTSVVLTSGNIVYNVTVTGLVSETDYVAYIIAQDDVPNLQSSGEPIYFTTTDITAPAWAIGYPSVSGITNSTAEICFDLNEDGSGYFVVVPFGSSAPSAAQIKAGTDSNDGAIPAGLYGSTTLSGDVRTTVQATNLSYSTYYTAYFVGEDDAENATATAVHSYNFRAAVPKVAATTGGYYSLKNIQKRRKKKEQMLKSVLTR